MVIYLPLMTVNMRAFPPPTLPEQRDCGDTLGHVLIAVAFCLDALLLDDPVGRHGQIVLLSTVLSILLLSVRLR